MQIILFNKNKKDLTEFILLYTFASEKKNRIIRRKP